MIATKIAFGLFSAANIAVWSLLAWLEVERALRWRSPLSSFVGSLLFPAVALLALVLAIRFKKFDLGGAFAFIMLLAAFPVAIASGGGI